jgi:hypothetical protein
MVPSCYSETPYLLLNSSLSLPPRCVYPFIRPSLSVPPLTVPYTTHSVLDLSVPFIIISSLYAFSIPPLPLLILLAPHHSSSVLAVAPLPIHLYVSEPCTFISHTTSCTSPPIHSWQNHSLPISQLHSRASWPPHTITPNTYVYLSSQYPVHPLPIPLVLESPWTSSPSTSSPVPRTALPIMSPLPLPILLCILSGNFPCLPSLYIPSPVASLSYLLARHLISMLFCHSRPYSNSASWYIPSDYGNV